jgi:hypothetical protein
MTFSCVVSVYKEDISFLKKYIYIFTNIYIYLKDETRYDSIVEDFANCKVEVLPNIGRESQTYVHHISKYYDSLEDYICFIQGHPFDHCTNFEEILQNYTNKDYLALSDSILKSDYHGFPHHGNLKVGEIYNYITEKQHPEYFFFFPGAQFIVCKNYIQNNKKEFYEQIDNLHTSTYDLPWILERLWLYILLPDFDESKLNSII